MSDPTLDRCVPLRSGSARSEQSYSVSAYEPGELGVDLLADEELELVAGVRGRRQRRPRRAPRAKPTTAVGCEPTVISDVTWIEWAQVLAAAAGIGVAALVAFMPYARRPKLSVEEDTDRSNSRVEESPLGGLPHVRVLVSNAKRRRAAQGARVLFEGYTVQGSHAAAPTTLGHPSLEWPSTREDAAATGAVTVFAGAKRPITLGYFVRVRCDAQGALHYVRARGYKSGDADAWYLKLTIGLDINDNRDKLHPVDDGYVFRLLVGADDGAARTFEVYLDWDGNPDLEPAEVLDSALDHLAVK
jgi:hypothetical protein